MKKIQNYIPIVFLLLLTLTIYLTGFYHMISFDTLRENHKELREIAEEYKIMAPIFFTIIFSFAIALTIPGGFFLSLFSGFLFPGPWRIIYVIIGATLGSVIFYLSAKIAFKEIPKEKAGPWLAQLDEGFSKNASFYMLSLRLIPFFPIWLVNSIAAFFNVRLKTFLWTTFLGIAPQAFLFTYVGSSLNQFFEKKEVFSFSNILNPEEKIFLVCLGICALIPIFVKNWLLKKMQK